jgi:hypothetical protein
LTVVALLAALVLALISQFPRSERSADDSFSSTVVFQKKIYDDATKPDGVGNSLDGNPPLDALLASSVFACALFFFRSMFAAVRQILLVRPAFFISASPRAPPAAPLSR